MRQGDRGRDRGRDPRDRDRDSRYGRGPERPRRDGPSRSSTRESTPPPPPDPDAELLQSVDPEELDRAILAELSSLGRKTGDEVARRLVVAGQLVDEDPEAALVHARKARSVASRVPAVREAVGLAAYLAGEFTEALAELRTVRRMTGSEAHLAVLADCERALGRPERALELWRTGEKAKLDTAARIELLIVAAGARRDLGQAETATTMLQVPELAAKPTSHVARLRYAFAECLLEVGREEEAVAWFVRAADADEDGETDAADRALQLQGISIEGDDEDEDEENDGAGASEAGASEGGASEGDGETGDEATGDEPAAETTEDDNDADGEDEHGAVE